MLKTKHYDIAIIGAGPVGLAFACSLKNTGLQILLVEKAPLDALKEPSDDGREIALTHASIDILKALGAWDKIDKNSISPLKRAQVFNGEDKTPLDFCADKSKLEALGYLVANYLIRQALFEALHPLNNITLLTSTNLKTIDQDNNYRLLTLENQQGEAIKFSTNLLVGADSRMSKIRTQVGIGSQMRDFSKTMIVCRMQHNQPHFGIAYEYFFDKNTLALLPLNADTCSTVITLDKNKANAVMAMNEVDFNRYVSDEFSHNLGEMQLVGKRFDYPLLGVLADSFIAPQCALIGDAAVGMHPVTAHGFNLGLSGQNILANEIKQAHKVGIDIGGEFVLKKYQSKQMPVSKLMYFGTNGIVALFANNTLNLKPMRNFVLKFAQKFPPIHYAITKHLTQSNKKHKTQEL